MFDIDGQQYLSAVKILDLQMTVGKYAVGRQNFVEKFLSTYHFVDTTFCQHKALSTEYSTSVELVNSINRFSPSPSRELNIDSFGKRISSIRCRKEEKY